MAESTNCGKCLYNGVTKQIDEKNSSVFCLINGVWLNSTKKCEKYQETDAGIPADIRNNLAIAVRLGQDEDNRLKKIIRSTRFSMVISLIVATILFFAVAKFFDKYLF